MKYYLLQINNNYSTINRIFNIELATRDPFY